MIMKQKHDFTVLFNESKKDITYLTERAVLDFTEYVVQCMKTAGISRTELARRIKTSPAYITKILRGNTNFTLESMVRIAKALDCDLQMHLATTKTTRHKPV